MADLKISQLTASTTPLAGTEVLPIVQSSTTKQVSVANLTAGRAVSASSVSTTGNSTFNTTANIGWRVGARSDNAISAIYSTSVTPSSTNYALQSSSSVTYVNNPTSVSLAVSDNAIATATTTGLTLPGGNLIIGTSGKGIDFSATPGTGTSELLADYEEGTWTPVPTGVIVNSGTPVWSGTYTKVGHTVVATWKLTGGNVTISVGNSLTLPFTSTDTAWGVYGNNSSSAFIGGTQVAGPDMYFGTLSNLSTAGGTNVYQV